MVKISGGGTRKSQGRSKELAKRATKTGTGVRGNTMLKE